MPKKSPKASKKKRTAADKRAEYRAALKEFRSFHYRNETPDYLRARKELDTADRALPWWRR